MSATLAPSNVPTISPEVQEFAVAKGVSPYLSAAIDVAQRSFPYGALSVSVGRDAEDETHEYIAIDVDVGDQTAEEILSSQRSWSAEITRVCPPAQVIHFVLGWQ